jgi:hypothetical protein
MKKRMSDPLKRINYVKELCEIDYKKIEKCHQRTSQLPFIKSKDDKKLDEDHARLRKVK